MRNTKRIDRVLCLLFGILVVTGVLLTTLKYFSHLEKALQVRSVPADLLAYGPMGKILVHLGLVSFEENDFERFPKSEKVGSDIESITFQKKRQVGHSLFVANSDGRKSYESTRLIDPWTQKPGWPILSIVVDRDFLHHPESGLFHNKLQKGRAWERVAQVSYFEEGRLLFETHAGFRLHGGVRLTKDVWAPDYRIYFREKYGLGAVPKGLILPDLEIPLKTLVLKRMEWPEEHPANNPLAYDIAGEIGCAVPDTRLVEVYLNGESQGMAYGVEHLSRRQWGQRYDHDEYNFLKFRSDITLADQAMYNKMLWETVYDDENFSFDLASSRIDLDNFSRHVFSWVFSGTNDYCQGVAVYDKTEAEPRLSWINWDMDHSFYNNGSPRFGMEIKNWQKRSFDLVYSPPFSCGRSMLFHKLMNQSEQYRKTFIILITELLNHKLTSSYLSSRVAFYREKLTAFGEPHDDYIMMLNSFMAHRGDHLFAEMSELFGYHGPYTLSWRSNGANSGVTIDGYHYSSDYQGTYFSETPVRLQLPQNQDGVKYYWLINGERFDQEDLILNIQGNTRVEIAPINPS